MAAVASSANTLDVPSLVSQLMTLERQPIDKLNTKIASYQTKISSLGTISGLVSSFQTALQSLNNSLQGFTATPSDPSILSASASSTAVPGTYSLNVTSLAQAQNLVAVGKASSTATIGTGTATTVTFDFGTITGNTLNATTGKYGTTLNATVAPDGQTVTVASTANLAVGATISGPGFPPGTTIASITDGTTFTTSAAGTPGAASLQAGAVFTSSGSGTKTITIDGTNNTLEGIRDAINAAAMGISATIVNDGTATPYRLVLTSNSSGVSNSIKITTDAGDAAIDSLLAHDPAGTQNLSQTVAAQNAEFTVNGIPISKTSNTVTDSIQGVTLTLNKLTTTAASLVVKRDTGTISTAAAGFVDAFNALASQLKSRSAYGTATNPGGPLAGDGTVRLMLSQLRDILTTAATPATGGSLTMLTQVGISFQTDGSLRLDSSKLSSEMAKNFSDVTNLFSSATGFATRMSTWTTSALGTSGLIATRTANINKSIQGYNDEIGKLEARMVILQKRYTTTYSNLNLVLSSMSSTSAYLSSQFSKGA